MQFKIFTIPIELNIDEAEEELNKFLRTCKVVEIEKHLTVSSQKAFWTFCIQYTDVAKLQPSVPKTTKTDYKAVLTEEEFAKFTRLRKLRKQIADSEAVPAYAVFIDSELAEIAKLPEISSKSMLSIEGIGQKRLDKYGEKIEKLFSEDEASGFLDR